MDHAENVRWLLELLVTCWPGSLLELHINVEWDNDLMRYVVHLERREQLRRYAYDLTCMAEHVERKQAHALTHQFRRAHEALYG